MSKYVESSLGTRLPLRIFQPDPSASTQFDKYYGGLWWCLFDISCFASRLHDWIWLSHHHRGMWFCFLVSGHWFRQLGWPIFDRLGLLALCDMWSWGSLATHSLGRGVGCCRIWEIIFQWWWRSDSTKERSWLGLASDLEPGSDLYLGEVIWVGPRSPNMVFRYEIQVECPTNGDFFPSTSPIFGQH